MNYKPNINDPRVRNRIEHGYRAALATLSPVKPRGWHTRTIDKWFGQAQNNIGKWLRAMLLIEANPYYKFNDPTHKKEDVTKTYLLNLKGVEKIARMLDIKAPTTAREFAESKAEAVEQLFKESLETGVFQYEQKSNRLWNEIQNIESAVRKPVFARYGYVHEYDIKTAAPTILVQYARLRGYRGKLPTVEAYLNDSRTYRAQLADQIGITLEQAKKVITARFAGARLGPKGSIFTTLESSWIYHDRLKINVWFNNLSNELTKLWRWIKKEGGFYSMNSRARWGIYFEQELKVMRTVHQFLKQNNVTFFHEHDGWRAKTSIDLAKLEAYVQEKTGYKLSFDYELCDRTVTVEDLNLNSDLFEVVKTTNDVNVINTNNNNKVGETDELLDQRQTSSEKVVNNQKSLDQTVWYNCKRNQTLQTRPQRSAQWS